MTTSPTGLHQRTSGLRSIGAVLAAVLGVLAVFGGVAGAAGLVGERGDVDFATTAGPIIAVALGVLLLRVSHAVKIRRADRHRLDHLATAVGALVLILFAAPLFWQTAADPADVRTNTIVVVVGVAMLVGGIGLACSWLEPDQPTDEASLPV